MNWSASSAILTAQFMFHVAPQFEATSLDLFDSNANSLRLRRSQNIVGIDQSLRFNEHAVGSCAERDKITLMDIQGFKHVARNHYLSALPHASDPLLNRAIVPAIYPEYLIVRKCQGSLPAVSDPAVPCPEFVEASALPNWSLAPYVASSST